MWLIETLSGLPKNTRSREMFRRSEFLYLVFTVNFPGQDLPRFLITASALILSAGGERMNYP